MKKLLIFIFFLMFLFIPGYTQAAFGISPTGIEGEVYSGEIFGKGIMVIKGAEDFNADVRIDNYGDVVNEWINYDKNTEFTIPLGISQEHIAFSVAVPEGTEAGVYTGSVILNVKDTTVTWYYSVIFTKMTFIIKGNKLSANSLG